MNLVHEENEENKEIKVIVHVEKDKDIIEVKKIDNLVKKSSKQKSEIPIKKIVKEVKEVKQVKEVKEVKEVKNEKKLKKSIVKNVKKSIVKKSIVKNVKKPMVKKSIIKKSDMFNKTHNQTVIEEDINFNGKIDSGFAVNRLVFPIIKSKQMGSKPSPHNYKNTQFDTQQLKGQRRR